MSIAELETDRDPRSREARVAQSLAHGETIRNALANLGQNPGPHGSAIAAVLQSFAVEIRDAHRAGASCARIAKALRQSGVQFSEGALRRAVRGVVAGRRQAVRRDANVRGTSAVNNPVPPVGPRSRPASNRGSDASAAIARIDEEL